MSGREGGEAKQVGGARVSFAFQKQNHRRSLARTKAFQEDEEEDLDESSRDIPLGVKRPKIQRSQDGSGPSDRPKTRVIPLQSHTDWRQERKARLGIASRYADQLGSLTSMRRNDAHSSDAMSTTSPHEVHAPDRAFTEPQQQGLQMPTTRQSNISEQVPQDPQRDSTPPASVAGSSPNSNSGSPKQISEENAAVHAILSGHQMQGARNDTVIMQPTDEQMLRNDLDTCPDAPTLNHYESMPIEEFGAAMLRGMGWKDGSGVGKSRKGPTRAPEVQRRAALLGLGAKERTTPTGQKSDRKSYTPALRRDTSSAPSRYPESSQHDSRQRPSSRHSARHDSYRSSLQDDARPSSRSHRDDSYRSSHESRNYRREGRDDHRSDYSSRSYRR